MRKQYVIIPMILLALVSLPVLGLAQSDSGATQIGAILGNDTIVLDDVTFKIAPGALFFAADKKTQISLSDFRESDRVGFSINSDGQIDEMWLSSE